MYSYFAIKKAGGISTGFFSGYIPLTLLYYVSPGAPWQVTMRDKAGRMCAKIRDDYLESPSYSNRRACPGLAGKKKALYALRTKLNEVLKAL